MSIALSGYGMILFQQNKKDEAQKRVDEALKIAMREGDLWGQGYAFRVHADFLRTDRKFSESLELYKRASAIAQSIDDRISMGMELANMSLLANVLEEYQASGQYAEAALSVFQIIGNEYQQPFPQRMIAYAALHENNISRARSFCADSLRGNLKLGHTTGVLACLLAFAEIEIKVGNEELAGRLYGHVKNQQEKETVQLMEPDVVVLKKLVLRLTGPKDKAMLSLTIEDVIRELGVAKRVSERNW